MKAALTLRLARLETVHRSAMQAPGLSKAERDARGRAYEADLVATFGSLDAAAIHHEEAGDARMGLVLQACARDRADLRNAA